MSILLFHNYYSVLKQSLHLMEYMQTSTGLGIFVLQTESADNTILQLFVRHTPFFRPTSKSGASRRPLSFRHGIRATIVRGYIFSHLNFSFSCITAQGCHSFGILKMEIHGQALRVIVRCVSLSDSVKRI